MERTYPSILLLLLAALLQWPSSSRAWHPRLEKDSFLDEAVPAPVVGANRPYLVGRRETLIELARRSGTGYQALTRANPGIDPWLPPPGIDVELPYAFILPLVAEEGITINLAEQRLYYIWRENGRSRVRAYAIGIGREGWETPLGLFSIISKVTKPAWTPPPGIRAKSPELPAVVPPGPGNPLGDYWLGLSAKGYGIHGTHKPFGVGRRVSHGCLRLYPEDIEDLFHRVETGTPVRIIDQPLKVGLKEGRLYLEVHGRLTGNEEQMEEEVLQQARDLPWEGRIDRSLVLKALQEARGIPVPISYPLEDRGEVDL
ncbi:MAG: L,D-transpeptidase family protein [Syntrophotaleaceae bacterium]